ncbi:hypothetical protein PAERUG_P54_1_London_24_VIM_2_04_13_05621 [Pseudomonas aeruginosa]|nr:hypothetical protein PAERUG_P54_1_London_24_VIM_2_04_13_05621 [Pseudomonas aeruginosa]
MHAAPAADAALEVVGDAFRRRRYARRRGLGFLQVHLVDQQAGAAVAPDRHVEVALVGGGTIVEGLLQATELVAADRQFDALRRVVGQGAIGAFAEQRHAHGFTGIRGLEHDLAAQPVAAAGAQGGNGADQQVEATHVDQQGIVAAALGDVHQAQLSVAGPCAPAFHAGELAIAEQAAELGFRAPWQVRRGRRVAAGARVERAGYLGRAKVGDLRGHAVQRAYGVGVFFAAAGLVGAFGVDQARVGEERCLLVGAEGMRVGHHGGEAPLHAVAAAPFVGAAVGVARIVVAGLQVLLVGVAQAHVVAGFMGEGVEPAVDPGEVVGNVLGVAVEAPAVLIARAHVADAAGDVAVAAVLRAVDQADQVGAVLLAQALHLRVAHEAIEVGAGHRRVVGPVQALLVHQTQAQVDAALLVGGVGELDVAGDPRIDVAAICGLGRRGGVEDHDVDGLRRGLGGRGYRQG